MNDNELIIMLIETLEEIVYQYNYKGFGDPASRSGYKTIIAKAALAKVKIEQEK